MLPLSDGMRARRFPFVTVALIAAPAAMGGSLLVGPDATRHDSSSGDRRSPVSRCRDRRRLRARRRDALFHPPDGEALWAWILQRFSPELRPAIDRAGRRAWEVLGGFVRGTAQVATIDAVLIGIGLWLLDVPLAFALAVLVFMGSFVPYVGAFVSGLVAVLVALADGGWELALAVLGVVLLVQSSRGRSCSRSSSAAASTCTRRSSSSPSPRAARSSGSRAPTWPSR